MVHAGCSCEGNCDLRVAGAGGLGDTWVPVREPGRSAPIVAAGDLRSGICVPRLEVDSSTAAAAAAAAAVLRVPLRADGVCIWQSGVLPLQRRSHAESHSLLAGPGDAPVASIR